MQPETPATTPDPHAPYMQTMVTYTSIGVSTGGYGMLQWDRDGQVRLYDVDPATRQVTKVIFACLPSQIEKVKVALSILTLRVSGKSYNLDFSGSTMPWIAMGGAVGLYMAHKGTQKSGIQWWTDNLRAQGLVVKQLDMAKLTVIVLVIVFGLSFLTLMISMTASFLSQ